ncbi:MAG: NYN domain-containing protein, partial [Chloroflexota bacterium]|nr:NYN domain-containing protein [Chloroflexota bacterium]
MIERSRRVVLLIDYDNLQICASRDTPGRDLQLPPVVQFAQRYGTVILARAYAEWNLSTERLGVYKAGIEPAFAPVLRTESDRSGKSLADTVMVAEGMDMLWTLSPDVVVLATSDKDLIPLVRVAKQRGAFVVVLGSDFTAIPLREMADEHVTYKQLITDSQGRYVTEAGPARQPAALPDPARRRPTRERNGRERTPITPPAVAPSIAAAPPAARSERE